MSDCIFCKIIVGDVPAKIAYQDDEMLAFHDIRPSAPVHLLLIPKKHILSLAEVKPEDTELLGKLLAKVPQLAKEHGLEAGFKTQINTGVAGGQEVFHLHLHVMGRTV